MGFVFDTSEKGLETVMKDYQEMAMRFLWERGEEGSISRDAWVHVNKILGEKGKTISRASIINFLNEMVDEGILNYIERTGKGGYHRVYFHAFDEVSFKEYLVEKIIKKLIKEFPDAVKKVLPIGISGSI